MNAGEIRELRKSIGGLHAKFDTLNALVIRHTVECEVCRPEVQRHKRIFDGTNGHDDGLIGRVGRLERFRRRAWGAVCGLATLVTSAIAAWWGAK